MTDRPDLVIDSDGHVIEVDETYERIDPQYRERRPRYTQAGRGYIVRLVDGKVWGPETDIGFVGVNGNLPPPKGKAIHYRRMGTYNPWARLARKPTTTGCSTTARCARSGSRVSGSWRFRTWKARLRRCSAR